MVFSVDIKSHFLRVDNVFSELVVFVNLKGVIRGSNTVCAIKVIVTRLRGGCRVLRIGRLAAGAVERRVGTCTAYCVGSRIAIDVII